MKTLNNRSKTNHGFSLVEAVIALFLVSTALLGTAAAITNALQYAALARSVSTAKSMIVTSIEEIESLRNTRRLAFKQIANSGAVDNTGVDRPFLGFETGFRDVSSVTGNDGVMGTTDDLSSGAGPDGTYGTADDVLDMTRTRAGFSRQIAITFPDPTDRTIKRVEVRVRYLASTGAIGELAGVAFLNDELRQ